MEARAGRCWVAAFLGAVVLAAGGCTSDRDPEPDSSEPTSEPTSEATSDSVVVDADRAVRDACLSAIPQDAEIRALTLEGATDGSIQAVLFPSSGSRAALVLLPQVNAGVCGWGAFAHEAAGLGFPSIVVAPCSYGASTCSEEGDADPLNEVAPAIEAARAEFGTDRVVLVGASMGGSLTVRAAAAGADVDTWVDVSGPSAWEGTALIDVAGSLPAGGLVVQARSDGAAEYANAHRLARTAGARFIDGGSGHGYELMTSLAGRISRVGRAVLAHAKG